MQDSLPDKRRGLSSGAAGGEDVQTQVCVSRPEVQLTAVPACEGPAETMWNNDGACMDVKLFVGLIKTVY